MSSKKQSNAAAQSDSITQALKLVIASFISEAPMRQPTKSDFAFTIAKVNPVTSVARRFAELRRRRGVRFIVPVARKAADRSANR